MSLRFGTDGVRGVAGAELTPELVTALGRVAARALTGAGQRVLIGRDTRRSGPMLAAALAAGVAAEGVDVVDLGVVPTPAVAACCARSGDAGAVVSASHNPFADNGIKLLATGGRKLDDTTEASIEAELRSTGSGPGAATSGGASDGPGGGTAGRVGRSGTGVGQVLVDHGVANWYVGHLVAALGGRRLDGLRVALDCGHGAAAGLARTVFEGAGAQVVALLGAEPDGTNINAGCGATDPAALADAVVARRADLGLAFDGDADRVIAVSGDGAVVDGDRLLALFAVDLRSAGALSGDTLVVTTMTNLGLHQAMAAAGIAVVTTDVGDRYVLEALDASGWSLGGEQSGHLVFRDLATTGDGMLSGLLLCDLVTRAGRPLADLAAASMVRLPQVLRNVAVADRDGLPGAAAVWDAVDSAQAALAGRGRVLLRPSGTEKVVRVMVEAPGDAEAAAVADALAAVVVDALG